MEIKVCDMLVFEDESGNIYQDCVRTVEHYEGGNGYKLRGAVYKENKFMESLLTFEYEFDDMFAMDYIFKENKSRKYRLKEIWTKVNGDTYKKVWTPGEK